MPIYLVRRTDRPDYDEYDAFVIRAESKEEAKAMAVIVACDDKEKWMHFGVVTKIPSKGSPEIICSSFNAG